MSRPTQHPADPPEGRLLYTWTRVFCLATR
jgi:hypothetical protein